MVKIQLISIYNPVSSFLAKLKSLNSPQLDICLTTAYHVHNNGNSRYQYTVLDKYEYKGIENDLT